MAKIRKQTYSLDQYLKLMKTETIRSDQECQRMSGQWNQNMVNELIATVLTENYIPPIILGRGNRKRYHKTVDHRRVTKEFKPFHVPLCKYKNYKESG